MNCNGKIETTDPLTILREIAALPVSVGCAPSFDIDCDDSVSAVDALAVLRFIAALPPLGTNPDCPAIGDPEDDGAAATAPWRSRDAWLRRNR